jgi:lipopolysaccharide export system permease protein
MNLLFQMLGKIAGRGIPVMTIIEYFALNLAWILALAVPMAVLIATLSAYGRMSGDGEIIALRASGVSPFRLMEPAFVASILIALGVGLFNNYLLPEMNHRTKLLRSDIGRKKPTVTIDPGIFSFSIPNYVLRASEVNQMNGWMKEVTIFDNHEAGKQSTISSQEGQLRFVEKEERVLLTLYSGEIHRPSSDDPEVYEVTSYDSAIFRIKAPGMMLRRGSSGYRGDRELTAGEMWNKVLELRSKGEGQQNSRKINSFLVEIHKKFSIPVACIVFILIGAPLGMMAHRGSIGVSGGISLLFFTIYWAFLVGGEKLSDRELVSPVIAMWSPNVLFAIVGIWLIWLAKRRTSLPAIGWIVTSIKKLLRMDKVETN